MCQANLDMYQDEIAQAMGTDVYLPVFYFTELLGIALGHPQADKWLGRHLVNPKALLLETGIPPQVWERL
jgi:heterodisulfide reductase subunit B